VNRLAKAAVFWTHVSMPKKRSFKNNLTRLREGTGLSVADFARRIGVSASIIKKVEAGTRDMSQDLSSRIFAETGVMLISTAEEKPLEYSKAQHDEWKKEIQFDRKSVPAATRVIMKLVEVMLAASVRPGVQKSYPVFNALIQVIENVKNEFRMEQHIEAELRDRLSTEQHFYKVRELRENDLLAKQVGFTDDPKLDDNQEIRLSKPSGWLPAKDFFNIQWKHREFLQELENVSDENLTEAQKAKIGEIEKERDVVIDRFLPPA
jgi:transcriptional regulator with XRE-family HTH domain